MSRRIIARVVSLLLLGATLACGSYSSPSTVQSPVGAYSVSRFTTTANGTTIDQLAQGVTLTITLAADGTTTGRLLVPESGTGPVDLAGSWTSYGDVVMFHHPLQTFLDVLSFRVVGNQLQADGTVDGKVFRVTLSH